MIKEEKLYFLKLKRFRRITPTLGACKKGSCTTAPYVSYYMMMPGSRELHRNGAIPGHQWGAKDLLIPTSCNYSKMLSGIVCRCPPWLSFWDSRQYCRSSWHPLPWRQFFPVTLLPPAKKPESPITYSILLIHQPAS